MTLPALAGLVALALLVGACGDDAEPAASAQPITVEELIARSADTPVVVTGLLHADGINVRLCSVSLESFPPQCGGSTVNLHGLDLTSVPELQQAGDISWKDGAVLELRRRSDGDFDVVSVPG